VNVALKRQLWLCGIALCAGIFPVHAADPPWAVSLYAAAASNKFVSDILFDGEFEPSGGMIGLALDRRLFGLGSSFDIEAEAQLTHYGLGHAYSTAALGIGFRFRDFPWSASAPTSFAFYTGPSYADDPPAMGISSGQGGVRFERKKWLNYVALELAVSPVPDSYWDGVIRVYHRSGAFGLYSSAADNGTAIGLGIRRRF
jgi:hypothetical protein